MATVRTDSVRTDFESIQPVRESKVRGIGSEPFVVFRESIRIDSNRFR